MLITSSTLTPTLANTLNNLPPTHTPINITIPQDRTVGLLDIATIVNANNKYKADYQFELTDEEILELYPEYKLADIKDFLNKQPSTRNPITTKESPNGYANKLEYLINNNILSRTGNYIYNNEEMTILEDRTTHNPNDSKKTFNHKYYNHNNLVSKTDFISNLMKTQEVQRSRIIGIQQPHTQANAKGELQKITREPIEQSPYQDRLGSLGIDNLANDVIANYNTFRDLHLIATNDVTEKYLYKALQLGLITKEEIGGVEGTDFLNTLPDNASIPVFGSWYDTNSIRQMYLEEAQLSPKELESIKLTTSEEYFTFLTKYLEVLKTNNANLSSSKDGLAYPWGNSFFYSVGKCRFGNMFYTDGQNGVEILKRPSIIEFRNENIPDPKENGQGYQYFQREEMTVAEAYVYAYKFLQLNNTDTKLTQPEIDYVNSVFALDLGRMNAEEQEAVKYLLAKGVINPTDDKLKFATSNSLNNEYMIELLYRVHNKEARYEVNTNLSELDKDMLQKGYSQASINMIDNINTAQPIFDYGNKQNISWTDAMIKDRLQAPEFYDYIYVKMPNGFDITKDTVKAITDDEYRVIIPPLSRQLHGTSEDNKLINPPEEHKQDYYLETYPFVLNDTTFETPAVWQRYILHKSVSSNLKLNITMGGKTYSYSNFSGEGIYYPNNEYIDGKINIDLYKLPISEAKSKLNANSKPTYYNLYKYVIENDIAMRNDVFINKNPVLNVKFFNPFLYKVYGNDTAPIPETPPLLDSQLQSQGEVLQGTLKLGPYTETQLKSLTYNGSPFIIPSSEQPSGYEIDLSVVQSTFNKNRLKTVTIEKQSDDVYYLVYPATSSSIAYDMANFIDSLGQIANTDTDVNTKLNAYAQITADNQEIVLVSESDMKTVFNIEIVNDKLLMNKTTGQKAFLNTDESFTLIGNNITKYPKDKMFVIAMGEIRYYNLDIILELLNDTKLAQQKSGKQILVGEYDNYDFEIVNIYDSTLQDNKSKPTVPMDKTYAIYNKANPTETGVYINLSALSNKASNFIFFKDLDRTNLKMLLVYYPKDVDIENAKVTNNNLFNAMDKSIQTQNQSINRLIYKDNTKTLSRYLFSAGGSELSSPIESLPTLQTISMNILNPNYQYNLYFLMDENVTDDTVKMAFNEFKEKMLTIEGGEDLLNNSIIGNILDDKLGLTDDKGQTTNVVIDVLKTVPNLKNTANNSKTYFYIEKGSGNLYFRTQQTGQTALSNSEAYRSIFKNRIYSSKITKPNTSPIVNFRSKTYYTKTPEDYIPLEYLTINPTIGSFKDTSGNGSLELFKPENPTMHLSVKPTNTSDNPTGANILVGTEDNKTKKTNVALFTNVVGNGYTTVSSLLKNTKGKDLFLNKLAMGNQEVFVEDYNRAVYGDDKTNHKFSLNSIEVTDGITPTSSPEFIMGAYKYLWQIPSSTYDNQPFLLLGSPYNTDATLQKYAGKYNSKKPIMVVDNTKVYTYKSDTTVKDILKKHPNLVIPNFLPIPAGTTLVNPDGKLETITSPSIRAEVTFVSDLINNLLTKLILKNQSITLLSDVPKNSLVNFDGRLLLKTGDGGKSSWQQLMILPNTETDTGNYNYLDVSDYNLMYKLYLEVFNRAIPDILGAEGAKANMLQLSGNGLWTIPEYNLLVKGDGTPNEVILNHIGEKKYIWAFSNEGDKTEPMLIYYQKSSKIKNITDIDTKDKGYLTPIVNVIPTLAVKQNSNGIYDIIGFVNPLVYNIDLNDSYIKYLSHRNTDAFSPVKVLESLKSINFNGEYYRNSARLKLTDNFLFDIFRLIELLGCLFLVVQWGLVTCFFAFQHLPLLINLFASLRDFLGFDVVKIVSFGLFEAGDESTYRWGQYILYFFLLLFLYILLDSGVLINSILYLFNFILGGV